MIVRSDFVLQEVGKLRDERRALQYEVAELLAVKVGRPHVSIASLRSASGMLIDVCMIESSWSWRRIRPGLVSPSSITILNPFV